MIKTCSLITLHTAGKGHDYSPVIQVMEFAPGEIEKVVTVITRDDKNVENSEYFELYLSAGEGVHLSPFSRAKVVISDNDGVFFLTSSHMLASYTSLTLASCMSL